MTLLALQHLLRPFLRPVSWLYGLLMALRRFLWEHRILKAYQPVTPCVAVGNIALGGAGKTPVVDWIMNHAIQKGMVPAVLSRGYGARPPSLPLEVTSSHLASEAGDEPLMLRLRHPKALVLVDPKRARAARFAEERLHPDLFVLDDGFQHLAVHRHLNLVVLRPEDLKSSSWNAVLPSGFWRESQKALHSADAFLIKATPTSFRILAPDLRKKLGVFGKPVFSFSLCPDSIRRVDPTEGGTTPPEGSYVLVSGVGNPRQVKSTAARFMGRPPEIHNIFPDHHSYTGEDAERLSSIGLPVLCTSKDAVKLRGLGIPDLWEMPVSTVFGPSLWTRLAFADWWDAWYAPARKALLSGCLPAAPEGFDPGVEMLDSFPSTHA